VSYPPENCQDASRWPGLPGRPVRIGGITVTYAEAAAARAALAKAGGIMVRQVLKAAGSPLAVCDYHAAAVRFRGQFLAVPAAGRGAAGRPVARQAFIKAIEEALRQAETAEPARHFAAELDACRAAFGSDAGYAAAMAGVAVQARQAEHAARLRAMVTAAAREAVSACAARSGEFSCAASAACGPGDCRLASGAMAQLRVPAGPGRLPRPGNHVQAGRGFGTGPALAALEKAVPFTVAVRVSAAAAARACGAVAA